MEKNKQAILNKALASLQMVKIPAGNFMMGSNQGSDDEKPIHRVSVPAFKMAKNETTFALYELFVMDSNSDLPDDKGWGRGNRPVIYVSWDDAQKFIQWLNQVSNTATPYRLPSEAEWEYANRAGSSTKYWWGNNIGRNKANCDGCGSQWDKKETAPVGSFNKNPFGLNDTTGNVREWVQDCYHKNYNGAPDNNAAWTTGECKYRILRGGSWYNNPWDLRSADRNYRSADLRYSYFGFRLAQDL